MDPTVALQEALEALVDLGRNGSWDDRESAIRRLRALADWLVAGGFPPMIAQSIPTDTFRVGRRLA